MCPMSGQKKRLLTGLQPSGALHIGNYFGALKPFVQMYEEYESLLMIVDYHALTTLKDPDKLRENTIGIVKDYVAAGVDPKKTIVFKQSDIGEHTELAWIFECLVTVPFLMQAVAYKDKVAKGLEANAGLFNYPMLMAADILLYDTEVVPVGEDQRQHIEYTREAATKFNNAFGDTFIIPKEKILENVGTIPGTDGKKMSKSYKNIIPLFGSEEDTEKSVMSIVTNSSGSKPEHVYAIHKLLKSEEELVSLYDKNMGNHKRLKEILIEDMEALIAPMRDRRKDITDDDVRKILKEGSERASALAEKKMSDVRKKIGVGI